MMIRKPEEYLKPFPAHKPVKVRYQVLFWSIVLLHQFIAVDCLTGWRVSLPIWRFIQEHSQSEQRWDGRDALWIPADARDLV